MKGCCRARLDCRPERCTAERFGNKRFYRWTVFFPDAYRREAPIGVGVPTIASILNLLSERNNSFDRRSKHIKIELDQRTFVI
jgi:hypothetical protein